MSLENIHKLQLIQNHAARLVKKASKWSSAKLLLNLYRHTLFTPLYATRGSFGPGNI